MRATTAAAAVVVWPLLALERQARASFESRRRTAAPHSSHLSLCAAAVAAAAAAVSSLARIRLVLVSFAPTITPLPLPLPLPLCRVVASAAKLSLCVASSRQKIEKSP